MFTSQRQPNTCKVCLYGMRKKEREKNKDRVKREQVAWRLKNIDHYKQYGKQYRQSSAGKQTRYESYVRNRVQKRKYDKDRRQNVEGVREKYNATAAKYRAAKQKAIPKWFECKLVEQLYLTSSEKTMTSGILHHVDHIVPLQHPLVCGLHCYANLQIITSVENLTKHNTFEI